MPEPIVETTGPEFVAAFEANFADFFTTFGLMPGGEVHRDEGITWFASGFPLDLINGVVQTRLPEDLEPARVRARCEAVLARFVARAVPALWWLTPLSRPLDLPGHLSALGLDPAGSAPGMVIDLEELVEPTPAPTDLTIEEVGDAATLRTWVETFIAGYEAPAPLQEPLAACLTRRGLGSDRPLRHFLARRRGVPVATSSLLLSGGVASLNAVATLPAARRQGVGAAISAAPLRVARAAGYRVAILQASDQGYPVYRRLGFTECFSLPIYVWRPSPATAIVADAGHERPA
jgi:GNAT superfamily N-acetyltransferase